MNQKQLEKLMAEHQSKALTSLAGYKFLMFGYHAATWANLEKLSKRRHPNPFSDLVVMARENRDGIRLSYLLRKAAGKT